MSFGLKDENWMYPDEKPVFKGHCVDCIFFRGCPCGCGWGFCDGDSAWIDGNRDGCDDGVPIEDEPDENELYDSWKDSLGE